jgi:hypothetical protein
VSVFPVARGSSDQRVQPGFCRGTGPEEERIDGSEIAIWVDDGQTEDAQSDYVRICSRVSLSVALCSRKPLLTMQSDEIKGRLPHPWDLLN